MPCGMISTEELETQAKRTAQSSILKKMDSLKETKQTDIEKQRRAKLGTKY
jgi:hypothetical protein